MSEWSEIQEELWCVAYRASQAVERARHPHALQVPWWRLTEPEIQYWEAIADAVRQQLLQGGTGN